MSRSFIFVLLILFLWLPSAQGQYIAPSKIDLTDQELDFIEKNPVIRASNEADYVPYDFNINGHAQGYSVDLLNMVAERVGLTVSYVNGYRWFELEDLFKKNQLDVMHTLIKTNKRLEYGVFSNPYWQYKNYFIVRYGSAEISSPKQLYGKTMAVGKGWTQETFFKENYPQIKLQPLDDIGSIIDAVSTGRVDAMVTDKSVINYLAAQKGIRDLKVSGWAREYDRGENRKFYFMVQKTAPELQSILNKGLASLTPSDLLPLQKKWFGIVGDTPGSFVRLTPNEQNFVDHHPLITIGGGISFAPYVMINDFGETTGYDYDLTQLIAKRTGLRIDFKLGKWGEIQREVKAGDLDGQTASAVTEERNTYMTPTLPYLKVTSFLIVKKGNPAQIESVEDLVGKRIALQEGNVGFLKIVEPYLQENEILFYDTLTEVLQAVVAGEVDCTVFDGSVHYLASTYGIGQFIESSFAIGEPYDLVFYLKKDHPELVAIINKGLKSITEEEKSALRQKWFLTRDWADGEDQQISLSSEERSYLNDKRSLEITSFPLDMPYWGIGEAGELIGMVQDYLTLFQQRLGTNFNFHWAKSSDQALQMLRDKKIDLIILGNNHGDLFLEGDVYSVDYLQLGLSVATTNDKMFIEDITRELDKTFGVVGGSVIEEKLLKTYPTINLVPVASVEEGLELLRADDVYGFIDTPAAIGHSLQQHVVMDVKIAGKLPLDISYGFVTRSDSAPLMAIVKKLVESLSEGDKRHIYNSWVAVKFEKGVDYRLAWQVFGAAGILFAIILIWNRRINKERAEKQVALEKLSFTQKELEEANRVLRELADTDQLTGLYNRLKLDGALREEVGRKNRYDCDLSVILLDIDKFKNVNDTFGHPVGDDVLKSFAMILQKNLREIDIVGRWGGEEFLVICPETNLVQSEKIAEKLRKKIESHNFAHGETVTASFGIAELMSGEGENSLINYADQALYRAKEAGRNRVEKAERVTELI